MNNKTERYFVCSESELEAVLSAQRWFTAHDSAKREDEIRTDELWTRLQEAEAACRAREVERFYFATIKKNAWDLEGGGEMTTEDMIEVVTHWANLIVVNATPMAAYRIFKDRDAIIDALAALEDREIIKGTVGLEAED